MHIHVVRARRRAAKSPAAVLSEELLPIINFSPSPPGNSLGDLSPNQLSLIRVTGRCKKFHGRLRSIVFTQCDTISCIKCYLFICTYSFRLVNCLILGYDSTIQCSVVMTGSNSLLVQTSASHHENGDMTSNLGISRENSFLSERRPVPRHINS